MDYSAENQQVNEVERTIADIRGIEAVRVIANDQHIKEINILSNHGENAASLTKDIEAALLLNHGIVIEPKKINFARGTKVALPGKKVVLATKKTEVEGRSKLKSIIVETTGVNYLISVVLLRNNREFEGVACSPSSDFGKQNSVAQATLQALAQAYEGTCFTLEGVETVKVGSKNTICVCISLKQDASHMTFTGSAVYSTGQESEAIVKAVLAAANRKISSVSKN